MRADQEHEAIVAPADAVIENGRLVGDTIIARYRGDFQMVPVNQVQYIDVAPAQMVGVSAGLIPFLEHDDANRALMGSNMQRQAVPLLITEPPLVATGLEQESALNSSMLVRASARASSPPSTREHIEIGADVYKLRKFVGLNERTCQNQKPIVSVGDKIEKGQVIADGAATLSGRAGPGAERAGGLHGLGRLQLRGRHHHQRRRWSRPTPTPRSTSRSSTSKSARPSWAARSSPATSPTSARSSSATSTRPASCAWAPTSGRAISWWARFRPSRRPS